ncbi:MAG: hypothetical protein ACREPY_10015 [Rhodanobacteraceae bacterium]
MRLKSQQLNTALAIGALIVLQGCAQTGGTQPDTTQAASVPMQTTSASVSSSKTAAIPENDGKPVVTADTKDNFEAVAAAIRKEMQPGGRFAFVTKTGRQTVDAGLMDMGTLFDQYGGVDKMGPAAQGRLLQDQNSINEILARYDSNRRICWKETPVGTHFPTTVCRTLGEIHNLKGLSKHTLEQMRQIQRQQKVSPGH